MILNEDDVLLFNIFLLQFLAFYILFSTERLKVYVYTRRATTNDAHLLL